jgi:hypothetical protein
MPNDKPEVAETVVKEPEVLGEPGTAKLPETETAAALTGLPFDATDDEIAAAKAGDPKPEPPKQKPAPGDPAATDIEKQVAALRKDREREQQRFDQRIAEAEATAKFWADRAKQRGSADHDKDDDALPEAGDVDIVEALANKDNAAVVRWMRSQGLVDRSELDRVKESLKGDMRDTVRSERQTITAETRLIGDFPDLADDSSELFGRSSEIYRSLQKDMGEGPQAMRLAVLEAASELGIARAGGKGAKESTEDRARRVAAQDGPRQSSQHRDTAGDSDEMTPGQKRIAAAMGVSEQGYRNRAKTGVRLSANTGGLSQTMSRRAA